MSNGIEIFFLLSLACCWPGLVRSQLEIVKHWPLLDFAFPDEATKNEAIEKNYFVPGSSLPMDVDVHYSSQGGTHIRRIFVTSPRFTPGTPITLGTVNDQGEIHAYPDYSWHDNQGENCDGLTSVFRTMADKCNRLWVMDTGIIGSTQYCPPKLVAFNLDNDKLIYSHIVNNSTYIATSSFLTPVADVRNSKNGDCSDTFVYVADVTGFGILVVDVKNNRSWRVTHRLMYPFPSSGTFTTFTSVSFELMDGVLGMALSPYRNGGDRLLYFHALSSRTENVVRTSVIRNGSFINNPSAPANSMHVFPKERPNQSAAEAMDRNGIMYFGLMDPPSIWCWNSATEYSRRNFYEIEINRKTLQFASGVKVIDNPDGEQELWVLTSSFQKYITRNLDANEINFRIHAGAINDLLENSPCKNGPRG